MTNNKSYNNFLDDIIKIKEDDLETTELAEEILHSVKDIDYKLPQFNIDGFFVIDKNDNGVYLTVFPPSGTGQKIEYNEVINAIHKKNIIDVEFDTVKEIVQKAESKKLIIAPKQKEIEFLQDDKQQIYIDIDDDKMKAYISMNLNQKKLTYDDVLDNLSEMKIIYGIHKEKIKEILKNEKGVVKNILIAEGKHAIPPKDGYVKKHYSIKKDYKPKLLQDDSVDFKELDLITLVFQEQLLLEIIPPIPGKPGKNIFGENIAVHEGKKISISTGKNVFYNKEKTQLFSKIDGHIIDENNYISVESLYVVKKDVDYTTGNIRYNGSIIINGYVRTGFTVMATKDIEILGGIEAGNVISEEGTISVHKGIQNHKKTKIRAKKDIRALFIENSKVIAENNVKCREAILHSDIYCGGNITVLDGKGMIVGGIMKAELGINAKTIGSPANTPTELSIENFEIEKAYNELLSIDKKISTYYSKFKRLKLLLNTMKRQYNTIDELPEKLKTSINKQIENFEIIRDGLIELKQRKHVLEKKVIPRTDGIISIKNQIFPGVKINIRGIIKHIISVDNFVSYYKVKNEIVSAPYK